MSKDIFPDYVNVFTSDLEVFLDEYQVKLVLQKDLLEGKQPALIYTVPDAPWSPSLIIHQTERSLSEDVKEIRVRLGVTLPEEISDYFRGKEDMVNRYASLAAVISSDNTVDVGCQAVLSEGNPSQIAYMMSVAIMYGARSITESVKRELNGDKHDIEELSAWTDLDFEKLHYDVSHLGIGVIGHRYWVMNTLYGRLELLANHNNPFWNAGLLALSYYSKDQLGVGDEVSANDLNQLTFLYDDVPMFGAWCDDGDNFIFATFLPNIMKSMPDIDEQIVKWFMQRSRSVYWMVSELKAIKSK